jgi:hypothetical protein
MASEIFVRKFQNSLIPADGVSAEAMEFLKPGIVYSVSVKSSRKYKFLGNSMAVTVINYIGRKIKYAAEYK